jgi:hypothetical protein
LPYVNPPHLTIPFVPLSILPRPTAFLVWALVQVMLLLWLLWLLNDLARSWEVHERWLLLSAVTAFSPLMSTFLIGAFSLLLTICLLQFYRALKHGHQARAGLWLVLGTIKPQAVVLPAVVLLAARRWRALLSALLAGGALALVSALALGWQIWPDYLRLLRTHTGLFDAFNVAPATMHNFKGTLTLILGNEQSSLINQISYLALAASIAVTWWVWRNRWQPDDPDFELKTAFTLLLGSLFGVHVNPQDSLLLIVPAALFYDYLHQRHLPRRAFAAFALVCPFIIFVSEYTIGGSLKIRAPVMAMIVLLIWMGKAYYDERGGASPR